MNDTNYSIVWKVYFCRGKGAIDPRENYILVISANIYDALNKVQKWLEDTAKEIGSSSNLEPNFISGIELREWVCIL